MQFHKTSVIFNYCAVSSHLHTVLVYFLQRLILFACWLLFLNCLLLNYIHCFILLKLKLRRWTIKAVNIRLWLNYINHISIRYDTEILIFLLKYSSSNYITFTPWNITTKFAVITCARFAVVYYSLCKMWHGLFIQKGNYTNYWSKQCLSCMKSKYSAVLCCEVKCHSVCHTLKKHDKHFPILYLTLVKRTVYCR